jgi:molybdenum cofactor cytidylyltransferase
MKLTEIRTPGANQLGLSRALRIPQLICNPASNSKPNKFLKRRPSTIAFVGAGGKTTALFQLARDLPQPVIVTTTTHLGQWQIGLADRHVILEADSDLLSAIGKAQGVVLLTGPVSEERTNPLHPSHMDELSQYCKEQEISLLIEADGARQKPLKAPASHEPNLPDFIEQVVVVAGLSGLGKPLTEEFVHRPELFSSLSGVPLATEISSEGLIRFLLHNQGGRKNISHSTRSVVLLNQADTISLQAAARTISAAIQPAFNTVVTSSLLNPTNTSDNGTYVYSVHEQVGAILLAAGASKRFGVPKQILAWRGEPFVRLIAQTALQTGLHPVIVVTGAYDLQVREALNGMPVNIINNVHWKSGQASSIQAGLMALCDRSENLPGSVIFLLVDQPHVTSEILHALSDEHERSLNPVLAPLVDDRRANPVLFDQMTFPALMQLTGDTGGRGIFSKFSPTYLPWQDHSLLLDVDTPEDYRRLKEYWE